MADAQKTIEILLQFKQAGQELIQHATEALAGLAKPADAAAASMDAMGTESAPAVEQAASQVAKLQEGLASTAATAQTTAAAIKEVGGSASAAGSQMQGLGAQAKSTIGEVSSAFGRGSPFEQAVKALSGGGAVLGLGLLGTKINEMAKTLVDLKAQFNAGGISALDFGEKIAESIPVFGEFYKAGEAFRELLTGQQAAMDADTKAAKELNTSVDLYAAQMKAGKQVTQDFTDKLIELRNQMELLQTPFDQRKNVKNLQDLGTAIRDLDREFVDKANAKPFDLGLTIPADFDEKLARLRNAIEEQRKAVAEAAKEWAAAKNPKPDDASNVGFGVDPNPDTREADAGKNLDDQEKMLAALNNQLGDMQSLVAAQGQYKASVKETLDIFLQKQFSGTVEGLAADWTDAFGGLVKYGAEFKKTNAEQVKALAQQGNQLKESLETPLEKYQADLSKLQALMAQGVITPETFTADKKALDAALAKATQDEITAADDAAAKKVEAADQAAILMATGTDKLIAEAQAAYDRDVAAMKKRLDTEVGFQEQYDLTITALDDNLAQTKLDIQAAANAKIQQMQAEQARQEQQAQKQAIDFQNNQQKAAGELAVLTARNASDAQLAQIQQETMQLRQQWQSYYEQGLIDDTQYRQAKAAIDKEANEKELEINGTLVDGLHAGFQKSADDAKTQFAIGQQAAEDFSNNLGDTFISIVDGTKKAGDAFKEFALGVIKDIADMEIKSATANIVGTLFGKPADGSGGSGGGGGVNYDSIGDAFSSLIASFFANKGGMVPGYAVGGIAGAGAWGPDRDTLPAMLTPGEFVVRRQAVQMPGVLGMLSSINSGMAAMPRPSAGQLGPIAGSPGNSSSAPAGPSVQVVPAIVASDATMRTLAFGGRNALIDFMRSNKNAVNAALS